MQFVLPEPETKIMTFHDILQSQNMTRIQDYLQNNNVDVNDYYGSYLEQAVRIGNLEIFRLMLQHGADIHISNGIATRTAALMDQREILQLLLDSGAQNQPYLYHALQNAASVGNMEIIAMLHRAGVDIASNGEALTLAVKYDHKHVVEYLLNHGAKLKTLSPETVAQAGVAMQHRLQQWRFLKSKPKLCQKAAKAYWHQSRIQNRIRLLNFLKSKPEIYQLAVDQYCYAPALPPPEIVPTDVYQMLQCAQPLASG